MEPNPRKKLKHFNEVGHAHALTFSCYKRLPLLERDRLCLWFLEALEDVCRNLEYETHAFVVMPEHVHLVVVPLKAEYDIARFLHGLKRPVAGRAEKWLALHDPVWHERLKPPADSKGSFHFWQRGGGFDRNIFSEQIYAATIHYIHNNPVRRGLVRSPEEWKWSSIHWYERGGTGSIFDLP
ncbi:MAG: hypothetical protein C4523_11840 [Myxococcales bacterium]|nr:MAG: hypothetical protein C4523_11840 [Myxococcales bacterium]